MKIRNNQTLREMVAGKQVEVPTEANGLDKWEYLSITVPDGADLSAYGNDGWELVSVVRAMQPDRVTAFFKKSK